MLTDKTGRERHEVHFVSKTNVSTTLLLWCGKTMFVVWHNVFCVLFEKEDCHYKKGYQPLKDMGKTKDITASC